MVTDRKMNGLHAHERLALLLQLLDAFGTGGTRFAEHVTGGPELHDQGQHQQHQRLPTAEHGAGDEGHHAGLAQAPQAILQHHHHDRTQDSEDLQHEHHVGGQGRQRHPALLGPVAHRNADGPDTHAHWHAENGDADTQRQHQCTEGGPDAAQFEDRQPQQEEEDGNGCDERRQHGRLQRVVDLLPHDDGDSL